MASTRIRHINYPFGVVVPGGKVREAPDYDAYIVQLIKQVLLTAPGERVCRPDFGAGIRRQVFGPLNQTAAALTRTMVYEALNRWLGTLIRIEAVEATAGQEALEITVQYYVIARGERRILNEEVRL
jgi:phage baseplate assembly protein W